MSQDSWPNYFPLRAEEAGFFLLSLLQLPYLMNAAPHPQEI